MLHHSEQIGFNPVSQFTPNSMIHLFTTKKKTLQWSSIQCNKKNQKHDSCRKWRRTNTEKLTLNVARSTHFFVSIEKKANRVVYFGKRLFQQKLVKTERFPSITRRLPIREVNGPSMVQRTGCDLLHFFFQERRKLKEAFSVATCRKNNDRGFKRTRLA
jgi:hypothetical protein